MARDRTPILLSILLLALAAPAQAADVSVTLPAGDGFVLKDNTATIEHLRVDEATGNVSRNGSLFVHTTGGLSNIYAGRNAGGNPATTGTGNSGFGAYALFNVTTGGANTAIGAGSLTGNTTGFYNSAVGNNALALNSTGYRNSALGFQALQKNTASDNSAVGFRALRENTTGQRNSAVGVRALYTNSTGANNSAFGFQALYANTAGSSNTAVGHDAMSNSTGSQNSALGHNALKNSTGGQNSALGENALTSNLAGFANTAAGVIALGANTTGGFNAAVGWGALGVNTTGSYNVAVGYGAGQGQTTGSNNIYLVNQGVAAESGQIKIGITGTHTQATIAGISGNVVAGGSTVLVNASGQLGTVVSSARFKESVEDMGETSERLMALRPVSFHYRKEAGGDGQTPEYGLIAEEVAAVAPELVVHDEQGKPFTVRYHLLAPMLLNELQKQEHVIQALESRLEELEAQRAGTEG